MKFNHRISLVAVTLLALLAFSAVGCGRGEGPHHGKGTGAKDDRSEWWCQEHGIPEHLCSLCLPDNKVKAMFKDKGDWCKDHNRAMSQCFKCDPSKYAEFEKMYEVRYGEKPTLPPEKEFKKK